MHTRAAAFRDVNAQAFWRIFSALRKQTLELPNSVVRDINHFRKIRLGRIQVKNGRDGALRRPYDPSLNLECRISKPIRITKTQNKPAMSFASVLTISVSEFVLVSDFDIRDFEFACFADFLRNQQSGIYTLEYKNGSDSIVA
jgi:hypothetical protein